MDREAIDEIKRYFGVVTEQIRSEVRLVAETVATMDESNQRQFAAVREEIAEVKAMIKLSYRELDGRLRSLEAAVSELRGRLERVEARLGH